MNDRFRGNKTKKELLDDIRLLKSEKDFLKSINKTLLNDTEILKIRLDKEVKERTEIMQELSVLHDDAQEAHNLNENMAKQIEDIKKDYENKINKMFLIIKEVILKTI